MELEQIYTLIISAAPALTAIIGIIFAVVTGIKKFNKVDGDLVAIKELYKTVAKENAELKEAMAEILKANSELVHHVKYKEKK